MEIIKNFTFKQWIVVIFLFLIITFGTGFIFGRNSGLKVANQKIENESPIITDTQQEPIQLIVYVTGAVKNPDVYKIKEGSIIKDAVNAAGGPLDNADLIAVNFARKVQDGEEIIVPFKEDNIAANSSNVSNGSSTKNQKININTAPVSELESLPGIGEVKANAIVDYRKNNGLFKDIREIINVSGIGNVTFEKIKDLITVN